MAQGFTVVDVTERQIIGPNGQIGGVYAIQIETDLGSRGVLEIPKKQYEALDDVGLGDLLVEKAVLLDRPRLL